MKKRKEDRMMPEFKKPTNEQLHHRFGYHKPVDGQSERYARVRAKIEECAVACVAFTPVSPEQTRALNALDEAMFLFNAAIARHEGTTPEPSGT